MVQRRKKLPTEPKPGPELPPVEDVQPLTWLNSLPKDLPADCAHLIGAIIRYADGSTGYVIASITALAEFAHMRRNKIKPALDEFITRGYMRTQSAGYRKGHHSKTYRTCRPIGAQADTDKDSKSVPPDTDKPGLRVSPRTLIEPLRVSHPSSKSVPPDVKSVPPATHSRPSPQRKRTPLSTRSDLSIKDEDEHSETFWVGKSTKNPNGYFVSQGNGHTRPRGSAEVTLSAAQRQELFQSGLGYQSQLKLMLTWAGFNPEPDVPPDQNPTFRAKREDFIEKIRRMRDQERGTQ